MDLKVPADLLDDFVAKVEALDGKIESVEKKMKDLTFDYYDSKSRFETKQVMLNNYRRMLGSAKKVSEVLEIQKRIDEIQIVEKIAST